MTSILSQQIDLKKVASNKYTVSWDESWLLGDTIMGGCVVAQIHDAAAAHLVTDAALVKRNQPDILNLHLDFLRPCVGRPSIILINILKIGAIASTLQIHLFQDDVLKVAASATSTNFDVELGPSVLNNWSLQPATKPKPYFDKIVAHESDDNWLASRNAGEVVAFTNQVYTLYPRAGNTLSGICDAWNGFQHGADVQINATYVALLSDFMPSMSDTLLHNEGLYDAGARFERMSSWDKNNPGKPTLFCHSLEDAKSSVTLNATQTLDLEFKRRIPREGQRWMFTRTSTRMMEKGRMDVHLTMLNEEMCLVAMVRQVILVLEASRKFNDGNKERALL